MISESLYQQIYAVEMFAFWNFEGFVLKSGDGTVCMRSEVVSMGSPQALMGDWRMKIW